MISRPAISLTELPVIGGSLVAGARSGALLLISLVLVRPFAGAALESAS